MNSNKAAGYPSSKAKQDNFSGKISLPNIQALLPSLRRRKISQKKKTSEIWRSKCTDFSRSVTLMQYWSTLVFIGFAFLVFRWLEVMALALEQ